MLKKSWMLFILILLMNLLPINAEAESVDLAVAPILPVNQLGEGSYFNLLVKPGEQQEIQLQLENLGDQVKTVSIIPTTAFTNKNGQLDYSSSKHKPLHGPSFHEISSASQTVLLQPKQKKRVTFLLTIPEQQFSGSILGGFYIHDELEKDPTGMNQELFYVIGVMLREERVLPEPELQLATVTVKDQQIILKLKNPTGTLLSQYKLTGSLQPDTGGSAIPLVSQTISAAPQDAFVLTIPTKKALPSGSYTLHLKIKGEKSFQFQQEFLVGHSSESLLHSKKIIGLIIIISLVIVASICFFFKRRMKNV